MSAMKSAIILALCIIIGVDGKGLLRGKRNHLQPHSAPSLRNHSVHVGVMTKGLELKVPVENAVPGSCHPMTAKAQLDSEEGASNGVPVSLTWRDAEAELEIEEEEGVLNGEPVVKSITVKAASDMSDMFVKLDCKVIQRPQVFTRLLRVSEHQSSRPVSKWNDPKKKPYERRVDNLVGLVKCHDDRVLQLVNDKWTIAPKGSFTTSEEVNKDGVRSLIVTSTSKVEDAILRCELLNQMFARVGSGLSCDGSCSEFQGAGWISVTEDQPDQFHELFPFMAKELNSGCNIGILRFGTRDFCGKYQEEEIAKGVEAEEAIAKAESQSNQGFRRTSKVSNDFIFPNAPAAVIVWVTSSRTHRSIYTYNVLHERGYMMKRPEDVFEMKMHKEECGRQWLQVGIDGSL